MDEITQCTDSLLETTSRILSPNSRLAAVLPDFFPRQQQIDLAQHIAQTILDRAILVAEAGTGTGKTFAYLIPCLLSQKKVVVSTATKTLQDQLFQKDLPTLIEALGLPTRIQNLKGRANYICRYRAELYSREGRYSSQQVASDIAFVREKIPLLVHGERSELPEIMEDSPAWPYVTSTTDNCLGIECEYHKTCFLTKARKRALEADVVVINHHLFFADSLLKENGFGELLPLADSIVFDEAHQLVDIAANFYGERVSVRQFRECMDDTLNEWPPLDLVNQPLKAIHLDLNTQMDRLLVSLQKEEDKVGWEKVLKNGPFLQAVHELLALENSILECFTKIDLREETGLGRCKERWQALFDILKSIQQNRKGCIQWLEIFRNNVVFHATPFDVANAFKLQLEQHTAGYIFTSATLSMAGSFDCFTRAMGLEKAKLLLLNSPFDFQKQALLYLPRSLPDPKHMDYYSALVQRAIPIINACGGRCFFLFTSHRALQKVAGMLSHAINFPLLVQGEESKAILLARFRELGNAVLLGTSTFWEGVDVKGEALSCVIIDKIPFSSPHDPIFRGKMAYFRKKGLSGFDELSLPEAVLALKQGVGRLIRAPEDRGVLMIADPRLTSREYGMRILKSLPSMPKTRDENTALLFIQQLALSHEVFSD